MLEIHPNCSKKVPEQAKSELSSINGSLEIKRLLGIDPNCSKKVSEATNENSGRKIYSEAGNNGSCRRRYKSSDMEAFRFVNVEEQRKLWNAIYVGLELIVAREFDNLAAERSSIMPQKPQNCRNPAADRQHQHQHNYQHLGFQKEQNPVHYQHQHRYYCQPLGLKKEQNPIHYQYQHQYHCQHLGFKEEQNPIHYQHQHQHQCQHLGINKEQNPIHYGGQPQLQLQLQRQYQHQHQHHRQNLGFKKEQNPVHCMVATKGRKTTFKYLCHEDLEQRADM
ncbi:hypothetical protein GIB67_035673 [Kingdonia uniflora]|uniref:Uncharacterized protein n=1 Tax=Kingdonia uniflora TaxID=39325 RepID=A0A7J7LMJ2_9MAGN|nr:hypothetical protein GIB67_035673 [Kingdonia uniflora]